jgi:hypothetical protein
MPIKYLGFDVPILLNDGSVKLSQNLEKSDILMGLNHTSVQVDDIEIIKDIICKIIPRYGCAFTIGVKNKIDKELVKTVAEFPLKSIKIDPYFLGFCIGLNNYQNDEIVFDIKEIYEEIYNYIISMVKHTNMKYTIEKNGFLKIIDCRVIDYFRFYGLFSGRSIPENYKYNKTNFRYRLLGGILDAKGIYFDIGGGGYYEITDDEDLIRDIDYIAKSVGLFTVLYKFSNNYTLKIFGNNLYNIHSILTKIEIIFPNPVCDYKIAPLLFDNRCVKLNISGENIALSDFTLI